ncbi:MAG: hypothetical protein WD696_05615 [Bryobacteraceae bacterium]
MNEADVLKSIGLCASCVHMRRIRSDRGSVFYLCRLAAVDARFVKYPALPVRICSAYEKSEGPTEMALEE